MRKLKLTEISNFSRIKWLVGRRWCQIQKLVFLTTVLFCLPEKAQNVLWQQWGEIKWYILQISANRFFLWNRIPLIWTSFMLPKHSLLTHLYQNTCLSHLDPDLFVSLTQLGVPQGQVSIPPPIHPVCNTAWHRERAQLRLNKYMVNCLHNKS